ncbi:prepilin peptidase [Candidatus Wolfebacteria bacterium]|nr:prepilin peptidase [Candidatus Wolfebacteria bacterium]
MIFGFYLFLIGASFGSFINVVSLRFKPEQKLFDPKIIGGRSHCPNCHKILSWYELIPVLSFLIQLGKCRNCKKRISFQYPIVEILAGLIVAVIPWYLKKYQFLFFDPISYVGQSVINYQLLIAVIWIAIFLLFLLISIIDFREMIIPDSLNFSLGFLGLILALTWFFYVKFDHSASPFLKYYAQIFGFRENILLNYAIAVLSGMVVFGLIIILSRGRAMGWGDFKLVGALGLIFGWPEIIVVLILSFIVGALFGISLLIKRRKKMGDMIPFGPFLVIGSALTFFFGYQIVDFYFKVFKIY